jgi:hypothetical protein
LLDKLSEPPEAVRNPLWKGLETFKDLEAPDVKADRKGQKTRKP